MSHWGIDLGTTNTTLARWNREGQYPEMIHLEEICRQVQPDRKIEVKHSIPSSLFLLPGADWKAKVGAWPLVQRYLFLGQQALIGREALERDAGLHMPNFIAGFKPHLMRDGYRTVARMGAQAVSARQAATMFLRELLAHVKQATGERPRHMAFGTPVDSYEPYRAQLRHIASTLGIHHFQTVDEPIAAAIGYGLRADQSQAVVVVDFGGGTLDLALITMDEKKTEAGRCEVVAKEGLAVGGNLIDAWMVEEFCQRLGYDLRQETEDLAQAWWYRIMLEEACRVKESLFFQPKDAFFLTPPRELQRLRAQFPAGRKVGDPLEYTREDLVDLLTRKGLYDRMNLLVESLLARGRARGILERDIAEVLMVGGSTLLPEIYPLVEKRFGRDRVRAWQPFDAVSYGACAFAAGHLVKSDYITHDYAFVTYRRDSLEPDYQVIIRAGTPFPTPPDLWKRHLTPTCPMGEPERIFKLVVCELGSRHSQNQEFVWDEAGRLHTLGDQGSLKPIVIPLNESNPTLGFLDPPHPPDDRSARLEIAFGISKDRWLCATVLDLKTRKQLMVDTPVVRLK